MTPCANCENTGPDIECSDCERLVCEQCVYSIDASCEPGGNWRSVVTCLACAIVKNGTQD